MEQYISKSAVVAEIRKRLLPVIRYKHYDEWEEGQNCERIAILDMIDTLEVKEVDLIIHTIIAECCDWLAMNTNLSHDKIEGCRNLMLTVKEEQLKAQKGG